MKEKSKKKKNKKTSKEDKILLIIPAYNEEENILKVCKELDKYKRYDYVVINDGSKDNTLKILKENNINHIDLVFNLGIGGAMQTGYKYAYQNDYDVAVQLDGDGQHDPEYIKKITDVVIKENIDICIGTRYLDKSESEFQSTFMRRFGKEIISVIMEMLYGVKITDPTSGFRAVNKKIIAKFAHKYPIEYSEPESTSEMVRQGFKVKEVAVSMNERQGGVTSINFIKSIDYMIKVPLAIILRRLKGRG